MRPSNLLASGTLVLLVSGCGAPADPQLAMCQTLAKNLTGDSVTSFEEAVQKDGVRARSVKIAFATGEAGNGTIDCRYPINQTTGVVSTAPNTVMLNGQRVPTKELFAAGTKASGEIISGVAKETAAQTREYADDATEQARDLADKARDAAIDGGKALQGVLEK